LAFDIENNGFWNQEWGEKPSGLEVALATAKRCFAAAPKLIPLYSHRYLPAEPVSAGNPVLSVYQADIIYYGRDLGITSCMSLRPIEKALKLVKTTLSIDLSGSGRTLLDKV
jgi:hypothetical protein